MFETFNNREIAVAVWLTLGLGYAATKTATRKALKTLWKAFYHKKILVPLFLVLGYIGLLIAALHKVGLWEAEHVKNTILWGVSVAAVSLFRIPQIADDEKYFRNALTDNLKLIVILEFIVSFYTFPLWAELILAPFVFVLVSAKAFTEVRDDIEHARELLTRLLAVLGSMLVVFAVYSLLVSPRTFLQVGTLNEFGLPIVLTVLYLPFIYVLALYVRYENAFFRLNFTFTDPPLRRYAKRMALLAFRLRTGLLKRWLREIQTTAPGDRDALRTSINRVKELAGRNRAPLPVALAEGWSPYRAREYLIDQGLTPNDYHQDPYDPSKWFASSPYLEIGRGVFPTNIAYYVEGDEHVARSLKLIVNFNESGTAHQTSKQFARIIGELICKALDQEISAELRAAIMAGDSASVMIAGKAAALVRKSWPTGLGYELQFILSA